ncbi:MAG: hypothetical protein ACKO4Y_07790, partial [Flavobacteriales bacterium]
MSNKDVESYLHKLELIPNEPLPSQFDYPHQYVPNAWAKSAAHQLQEIIPNTFTHAFKSLGKMFGVLVVNTPSGIRFLAGFSGKIEESTQFPGFVPPIYNTLNTAAFFKQGERELNDLTCRINELTNGEPLNTYLRDKYQCEIDAQAQMDVLKKSIKNKKEQRDLIRKSANHSVEQESQLANESKHDQLTIKNLKKDINSRLNHIQAKIAVIQDEISILKTTRTEKSIALQQELFKSYRLLNFMDESSTVLDVFTAFNGDIPPSGTGECALPKLLHFA